MSSQQLDKKLDLSLDELIRQAALAKRQTSRVKTAPGKALSGRPGLAPKVVATPSVRGRAPVSTAPVTSRTGIAGKRQAMRAVRQAQATATAAINAAQRSAPKILTVKVADLKRRGPAAATPGVRVGSTVVNIRRNLARRIVNKALAPKQVVAARPRQQAVAAPVRRAQPAQQPVQRQARQQVTYPQAAPARPQAQQHPQQLPHPRQLLPPSLARRMRLQRQQSQAIAPVRNQQVARPAQQQQPAQQRGGRPRPQQQPQSHNPAPRILPAPRQQQQQQMLARVQQGGVRKNRQLQQPAQRRAPVLVGGGAGGGRNPGNQRAKQRAPIMPQQQARGNNRQGRQAGGGNNRQRAPIMPQPGNGAARNGGLRGRRGRR